MNKVRPRYHNYVLLGAFIVLVLTACGNPIVATPPSGTPTPLSTLTPVSTSTPLSTLTPVSTSTPLNLFFLGEILKTPQPSPWATSLPDDTGITPGKTTEAEVRSRFGDPDNLGCIIDNKEIWTADCQAPGDFRKIFTYPYRNLYLQVEQGRVVSVDSNIALKSATMTTVQAIVAAKGIPELVKFTIPEKRTYPIPANPHGELVYASKGVEFHFDCQKGSGQLCEGVPRDGLVVWETRFVPMNVTDWLEQEKTNPPFYPDRGLEFYIRSWEGFSN